MRFRVNGITVDTDAINNFKNGMNDLKNGNLNTNNSNNNNNKVKVNGNPVLFIVVGLIFLAVGFFMFTNISKEMEKQKNIKETYKEVVAEVKEVEEEYDSLDEEYEYFVTVVYEVDGTEYSYKFKSNNYVSRGDEYDMYYDPTKPYISMLVSEANTGNNMIIGTIAFGGLGLLAIIVGIFGIRTKKKEKEQSQQVLNTNTINPNVMPNTNNTINPSVMPNTSVNVNPTVLNDNQSQDSNQNNML